MSCLSRLPFAIRFALLFSLPSAPEVASFGRRYVRAVGNPPPNSLQPSEGGFFHDRFRELWRHGVSHNARMGTAKSPSSNLLAALPS
jgi:hypothetical protein